MTWKCPDCGKKLKKKGTHPQTHDQPAEIEYNAIEEFLSFGPQLGGEISRLRALRDHDHTQDWDSVYHSYAKISKEGIGKKDGNFANTRAERSKLRQRIWQQRTAEKW